MIKDLKRRYQRIRYWLPILWENTDQDYFEVLNILKHELAYLEKRVKQPALSRAILSISAIETSQTKLEAKHYLDNLTSSLRENLLEWW